MSTKQEQHNKDEQLQSQMVIYQDANGNIKLDVRFDGETVWLSQKQMAVLFNKSISTINEHIKNIFADGELVENSVIRNFRITGADGKSYQVIFYNLDVIISVGYRVKSVQGTKFRIWATQRLKEYIIKGFTLDEERLKNPDQPFDYFEELAQKIQDIRTSEKRFYRKITDIYALSIDYDPTADISINFFKTVQNKLHWAVTGQTASEIIANRADGDKQNMGLTNWRGDTIRKTDTIVAKNYLSLDELAMLNNLVEQYLIFAQGQAMQRISMSMQDWINKLDGFLKLNDKNILSNAGKISHELALEIAYKEYDKYYQQHLQQETVKNSDFDNWCEDVAKTVNSARKISKKGN
jgi:hypothetical protein